MNEIPEIIFSQCEKLIYKIASKFYSLDSEDLYQAGRVGVIKAYKNYKENGSAKFSTYAYDYIFGEMYNLTLKMRPIKVNKDILRLCKNIEEARQKLSQLNGKTPTNYELSLFLEMDEETIYMVEFATSKMISLDETLEDDNNLHELIADKKEVHIDERLVIEESLETLNQDEQNIIKSRYFEDLSQSETAKKLGMSQAMISRYEKKSLDKMRTFIAA